MLSTISANRLLGWSNGSEGDTTPHGIAASHLQLVAETAQAWNLVYWIEVPLRNIAHSAFIEKFGPRWWEAKSFALVAGSNLANEALRSRRAKIENRTFLDDLSFGFWVRCFGPRQLQRLWALALAPHFGATTECTDLYSDLVEFKSARNAIAHHELRSEIQLAHMRQVALRIAACIDPELSDLIEAL